MDVRIRKSDNCINIGSDFMKDVETASLYVCMPVGSRHETSKSNGISHFFEHMAFKGTNKRNYQEIAEAVDNVGGIINAYTSRENTCYYIKVINKDIELAFDILSDIVFDSVFDAEEINKEKGVILQELAATLDTPSDVVFDYFFEQAFNSSIGMTILGPAENIKSFSRDNFLSHVDKFYGTDVATISIAGNIKHEVVDELTKKYFNKNKKVKDNFIKDSSIYKGGTILKIKSDLEQAQFILAYQGPSYNDMRDFYVSQIASNILGSGMSSRLFQEIREKRGLVYTVSSFDEYYSDVGLFGVYAGTSNENVQELSTVVHEELQKFAEYGPTAQEFQKTINQFSAGILMSMESTNARAQKLGYNIMRYNRYLTKEEILDTIKGISSEEIIKFMQKTINSKPTVAVYGNDTIKDIIL